MKLKFKNIIVISLIFTIIFSVLPTISIGATYDEESAINAYIAALEACDRDSKNKSEEEIQQAQYDCLQKMINIWYNTGDNASTVTIEETTVTDADGNTKTTYSLSDGNTSGVVTRIFNLDIYPAIQEKNVTITNYDGTQIDMSAGEYLNGIRGDAQNQIYGRNEEKLENYLINQINPNMQLDTEYVTLE